MRTTKMLAVFGLMAAMLLSGCSGDESNSAGNGTVAPRTGIVTMDAGTGLGNTTGTPEMMGTAGTSTTPGAMTTLNANKTSLPGVKGAMDTTGTPTVLATMNTTMTQSAVGTLVATGTPAAMDTTATQAPVGTLVATGTPAAMETPNSTATVEATPTPAVNIAADVPGTGAVSASLLLLQSSFEQIYTQVNPSVVYIEVVEGAASNSGTGSGSARASGSGFVWDAQGHVVTNNHVIAGATTINVTFVDGTTVAATVVGQDPNADLAVLQVTVPASVLHPVKMADSTKVRVGQIAIAIGNPFGLEGSMSEGIISALARSLPVDTSNQNQNNSTTGVYNIPNIIQTDAAINPGNSGGVLVNLQGEVIGVTAAIASQSQSNSGIGFVIPAEIVVKVVPGLISNGSYAHPWLGVSGGSLNSDVRTQFKLSATQRGAMIMSVTPGGPAAAAGLLGGTMDNQTGSITKAGDIITAINGQPVRVFEDLGSYLFLQTKPGDVVTLTVLRDGKEQTIKVTLGTLPTP